MIVSKPGRAEYLPAVVLCTLYEHQHAPKTPAQSVATLQAVVGCKPPRSEQETGLLHTVLESTAARLDLDISHVQVQRVQDLFALVLCA